MLEGWSFEWALLQQEHYKSIKSRRTGTKWASGFIRRVWLIAWEMWSHRNGVLHQLESGVTQDMECHCTRDITLLYPKAIRILSKTPNMDLVMKWLPTLCWQKYAYKQEWIKSVKIAILAHKEFLNRASQSVQRQRQLLRRWLQR